MAKFELRFKCLLQPKDHIKCEFSSESEEPLIVVSGVNSEEEFSIFLDKSTAIKFAKTLRTEINKITESEVDNV